MGPKLRQAVGGRPLTAAILVLMCGVFVIEVVAGREPGFAPPRTNPLLGPSVNNLIALGARVTYLLEVQPWRLFTAGLLHAGLVHLLLNGVALWQLGGALEALVAARASRGWTALLPLLLALCSVAGMVSSGLFAAATVSVGVSGGLMGLLGWLTAEAVAARTWGMVAGLLASALVNLVISAAVPLVDNFAHIGGLLAGLLLGAAVAASSSGLVAPPPAVARLFVARHGEALPIVRSGEVDVFGVLHRDTRASGVGLPAAEPAPTSAPSPPVRLRSPWGSGGRGSGGGAQGTAWGGPVWGPGCDVPPGTQSRPSVPEYCLDVVGGMEGAPQRQPMAGLPTAGAPVAGPGTPRAHPPCADPKQPTLLHRIKWRRVSVVSLFVALYLLLVGVQARALRDGAWADPAGFCPGCKYLSCIPSGIKAC